MIRPHRVFEQLVAHPWMSAAAALVLWVGAAVALDELEARTAWSPGSQVTELLAGLLGLPLTAVAVVVLVQHLEQERWAPARDRRRDTLRRVLDGASRRLVLWVSPVEAPSKQALGHIARLRRAVIDLSAHGDQRPVPASLSADEVLTALMEIRSRFLDHEALRPDIEHGLPPLEPREVTDALLELRDMRQSPREVAAVETALEAVKAVTAKPWASYFHGLPYGRSLLDEAISAISVVQSGHSSADDKAATGGDEVPDLGPVCAKVAETLLAAERLLRALAVVRRHLPEQPPAPV